MPAVRLGAPLRLFWRLHRAFMRATGGRFGRVGALPSLLLTTRGRRSGAPRDVALSYLRDGEAFVVVASYAGEHRDPAWWLNLKAQPDADVMVDGKRLRVRARELEGDRRALLWSRVVERDGSYDEYQRRTTRRLPLVALEPR
jgi:deazaflavin-dependent oxidoreductase (nitroreductase family)